jgi:hypothetical protein
MNKRIYLSPPDVGEKEKLFLLDAFNSNWIAPLGPYVDDFEQDISHYLKVKNACALSSGTAALHLALRIIDVNEGDIVKASNSSCSYVFSVSSKDKFGDNGIIGVIILVIKGKKCHIDTLLLSCRVIGREIEKSMVAFIAKFSKQIRVSELVGIFIQTKKNTPASLLYNNVGFKQESEQIWIADLKKQVFKYSKFLDTKNDVLNEIKQ